MSSFELGELGLHPVVYFEDFCHPTKMQKK
jgi:hypothetical protein